MGPSVKFVSAIKDAIFNKKNGGKFFFFETMPNWGGGGGGSEGSLAKDQTFSGFFSSHPSLTILFDPIFLYVTIRHKHEARSGYFEIFWR